MFKIFNANGGAPLVTISNEYQNFHLRKSGLLHDKDFLKSGDSKSTFIDTKGMNYPVIVLKPRGYDYNSKVTALPITEKSVHEGTNRGFNIYIWHNFTLKDPIEYYIFDIWQPPERGAGLKLWNDKGELVYHSAWYRLKLVSFHELSYDQSPDLKKDYKVDISAYRKYSNNLGVFIPYVRRAMLHLYNSYVYVPGGFTTDYAAELAEGFFFRDENTVQHALVNLGSDNGWWKSMSGWTTPGSTYIFMVDLDGIPLGYGN